MHSPNDNAYKLKKLVRVHLRSYKWAFRGLFSIFLQQFNFKLELFLSFLAIFGGFYFKISQFEWIMVVLAIFMVLIAEALNSAIEAVCDAVTVEKHQDIRFAKDVGAGAVLLAVLGAGIIGLIIYIPYLADSRLFN